MWMAVYSYKQEYSFHNYFFVNAKVKAGYYKNSLFFINGKPVILVSFEIKVTLQYEILPFSYFPVPVFLRVPGSAESFRLHSN